MPDYCGIRISATMLCRSSESLGLPIPPAARDAVLAARALMTKATEAARILPTSTQGPRANVNQRRDGRRGRCKARVSSSGRGSLHKLRLTGDRMLPTWSEAECGSGLPIWHEPLATPPPDFAALHPGCGARRTLLRQLLSYQGFEVAAIDALAVLFRQVEAIEDFQRLADVHRPLLGIERAVRREDGLLEREEFQPAHGGRARAEYGGVGIKILLEVVERRLLHALAQRHVILVRRTRAELVPAGADAAFHHRHDAAEMVHDNLQVGIFVERLGEHQARHGGGGLVRPTERPPDLVQRLLLVDVVGMVGAARRVHPDRLAEPVHGGEERLELRPRSEERRVGEGRRTSGER